MKQYWNYGIAGALCAAGTVLTALSGDPDWYWLAVSDANVAIWLYVAALMDDRR